VAQQQIALLGRHLPACAVGPDAHADRSKTGQRLDHVEVLGAVTAMPAVLVAVDRADQPDLLVIAQRRLAQPAAP
jgi:hypothetical protein